MNWKFVSGLYVILLALFLGLVITSILPPGRKITFMVGGGIALVGGLVIGMLGWLPSESKTFGLFSGLVFAGIMVTGLLNPNLSQSTPWLISGIICGVLNNASVYCMGSHHENKTK